jgi:hypothetical protein
VDVLWGDPVVGLFADYPFDQPAKKRILDPPQ